MRSVAFRLLGCVYVFLYPRIFLVSDLYRGLFQGIALQDRIIPIDGEIILGKPHK